MTEAIFALIGVVVGAAVTTGFEWWREWRRESGESVTGLHLLDQALLFAKSALETALEAGYWARGRESPAEGWKPNRAALARVFTRAEWQTVAAAIVGVELAWTGLEAGAALAGGGADLTEIDRDTINNTRPLLDEALAIVDTHAERLHERRRWWRT
jgi:hypothetical protein